MSFGYAVGDVIVIGKLAWSVYKSCIDAPASFGNIAQEVIALEVVIRQFSEAFEWQELSDLEKRRLEIIGKGCEDVLRDLQTLVNKYDSLGLNAKLSFDRLKWAAAPVDELRTRLISNTTILSAFIQTSPVVILKHVKKIVQQYQDGKREGSVFSSLSADSLTSDERTQWRTIRKELESSGLTLAVLDKNRELILECLTNALGIARIQNQNHSTSGTDEGKGKKRDVRFRSLPNRTVDVVHSRNGKGKEMTARSSTPMTRDDNTTAKINNKGKGRLIEMPDSSSEQKPILDGAREYEEGRPNRLGSFSIHKIDLNPFTDRAYELHTTKSGLGSRKQSNEYPVTTSSGLDYAESEQTIYTPRSSQNSVVRQDGTSTATEEELATRTDLPRSNPPFFFVTILPKLFSIFKRGRPTNTRPPEIFCCGGEGNEAAQANKVHDRNYKVLLLGTSQSGKSTLLQQMNILANPLSIDMRKEFRERIIFKILRACYLAISKMREQEVDPECRESWEGAASIIGRSQGVNSTIAYLPECYAAIKTLEFSVGFISVLQQGIPNYDNFTYYLAHLDRIFAVDYVPSTQDILCYSTLTSGITKTVFEGDQSESSYHVIDLGGSRAEQRKWIRAFHHVSVLIFIVPVDGYARCLPEDETRNVMKESLRLFQHILETHWFKDSRIMLLLTKVDQLPSVLVHNPVHDWWLDYHGNAQSEADVTSYVTRKFLSLNADRERLVSVHCINLIDTEEAHRLIKEQIFISQEDLPSWMLLKARRENEKYHRSANKSEERTRKTR